jgi:iron complex outermembrane recepter protein
MKFALSTALFASCSALVLATPALAQNSESGAATLDTIVVTAQNRAEDIQDVPIAISVISAEQIRDAGVTDFREIERVAPSLNVTQDTSSTRVSVRGVGTQSSDEAQDQSIAINIDGEYLNRPNVLNVSLFDLDRVEVLRGPQGTLYGRNATGGAVNFITRKPNVDDFTGNGSFTYGNYDQVTVEGAVNIPFGWGGLRLAGIANSHEGYFTHPNINAKSGSADTKALRASLRLTPTEKFTLDLVGEYGEVDNVLAAFAAVDFNTAGNGPGPSCALNGFVEIAPATPGVQCIPRNSNLLSRIDRDTYNGPATGVGSNKQSTRVLRARAEYDFGPATLTYTGGFRNTDQDSDQTLPPAYIFYSFKNETETQSHEVRLNGGQDGGLLWQGGAFYYNEQLDRFLGLYNRLVAANGSFINTFTRVTEATSWAAFGQADVPLTSTLTLVAGARYTNDERSGLYGNYGFRFNSGPVAPTTPPPQILTLAAKGEQVTGLLGLNYKPTDDLLVFGKVSTGYKAGGFDSVGDYAPEKNTAYEAGVKWNFGADGQHKFNVSGFRYDYQDLQVSVLLNAAVGSQIFNAGGATVQGVEAELDFEITERDMLSVSVNYLDAQYDELKTAYAVFCVGCADTSVGDLDSNPATITQPNLAGNRLPQSPKWVITVGYDHVFDLGDAGELTASAYTKYKSSYFLTSFNYKDDQQKSFTQTDLSLKYKPRDHNISVQAFVRNIENEQPLVFSAFTVAGPDDLYNWGFGPPRTYGVRVAASF